MSSRLLPTRDHEALHNYPINISAALPMFRGFVEYAPAAERQPAKAGTRCAAVKDCRHARAGAAADRRLEIGSRAPQVVRRVKEFRLGPSLFLCGWFWHRLEVSLQSRRRGLCRRSRQRIPSPNCCRESTRMRHPRRVSFYAPGTPSFIFGWAGCRPSKTRFRVASKGPSLGQRPSETSSNKVQSIREAFRSVRS